MKMLFSALAVTLVAAAPVAAQAPAAKPPAAPAPTPVTRAAFVANVDTSFKRNDANKDGFLTKAEIGATQARAAQQVQARLTVRRKEAFDKVDANRDGAISFSEFAAAMPVAKADDGTQAIAVLDTNKDGRVSTEEFRSPAVKRFDGIDKNRDGIASLDELRAQK